MKSFKRNQSSKLNNHYNPASFQNMQNNHSNHPTFPNIYNTLRYFDKPSGYTFR